MNLYLATDITLIILPFNFSTYEHRDRTHIAYQNMLKMKRLSTVTFVELMWIYVSLNSFHFGVQFKKLWKWIGFICLLESLRIKIFHEIWKTFFIFLLNMLYFSYRSIYSAVLCFCLFTENLMKMTAKKTQLEIAYGRKFVILFISEEKNHSEWVSTYAPHIKFAHAIRYTWFCCTMSEFHQHHQQQKKKKYQCCLILFHFHGNKYMSNRK